MVEESSSQPNDQILDIVSRFTVSPNQVDMKNIQETAFSKSNILYDDSRNCQEIDCNIEISENKGIFDKHNHDQNSDSTGKQVTNRNCRTGMRGYTNLQL